MKIDDLWNRDSYLSENNNESINADALFYSSEGRKKDKTLKKDYIFY